MNTRRRLIASVLSVVALCGAMLTLSAAVWFSAPRYQVVSDRSLLIRLDTRTGALRAYTFTAPDEGYKNVTGFRLWFDTAAKTPLDDETWGRIEKERTRLESEKADRRR